jgi:hypothetical protein
MRSRPNPLYRLLHRDYHESFNAYAPRLTDFHDMVAAHLPSQWRISRQDIWFHCSAARNVVPRQGWKIHLSATAADAHKVLAAAITVLFKRQDTNFKFALDIPTMLLINGKNWPRGGSGKFITVYPSTEACFLEIIEELHNATVGLRGPYILSDQRYPGSGTVFFRYGGVRLDGTLNVRGERVHYIISPDGDAVPDYRAPYPVTPQWVAPMLSSEENCSAKEDEQSLKNGRYRIENVFSFSSSGGVYLACDRQTGKQVVIKEARPFIDGSAHGEDAVELLQKEYRLLHLVADTGIAPRPVDLFQDWEHWFLVEEHINGIPVAQYSAESNILLRTRPTEEDYQNWYETFRDLALSLIHIVEVLHRRNIVFGDLSPNNLLVLAEKRELRVIDFEGAYEKDVDRPAAFYTPGFISPRRLEGNQGTLEDDYYSLGAVLFSYLLPVNGLFHFEPEAKRTLLQHICVDARLPKAVAEGISDLLNNQSGEQRAAALARALCSATDCGAKPAPDEDRDEEQYQATLDGIVAHIESVASYHRKDLLYPADARVFSTNPLGLAYGAIGIAYALKKVVGACPQKTIDWIVDHPVSREDYPPGLYIGLSGIAWGLLEIGQIEPAQRTFKLTLDHPLLTESMDMYYGIAGWGMTCLRFYMETNDELYLDKAEQAGAYLLSCARRNERGTWWNSSEGVRLGIAHGASGIALFLLYLYLTVGDERYLATGCDALQFDVSHGVRTLDGGMSWPHGPAEPSTLYPYWRFGSAGIGCVVLRYHRAIQDQAYVELLEKIFIDTDRKYAVFPGRFVGLAGLGDFLLDMHQFTGEKKYLESAQRVSRGIMNFRVRRAGIAFPGDTLSRLCCDYGTGSAGTALFLNRLLRNQPADFMLDRLFDGQNPSHAWPAGNVAAAMESCC